MSTKITRYRCDICKREYPTLAEAEKCEAVKVEPEFSPGDIVFSKGGFGWYDGSKDWVSNPDVATRRGKCPNGNGNCFEPCCTYLFYYAVTAVGVYKWAGQIEHRAQYHVRTLAMTVKSGHGGGYTNAETHIGLTLVPDPPEIVKKQVRALIGWESKHLL